MPLRGLQSVWLLADYLTECSSVDDKDEMNVFGTAGITREHNVFRSFTETIYSYNVIACRLALNEAPYRGSWTRVRDSIQITVPYLPLLPFTNPLPHPSPLPFSTLPISGL